MIIAVTYENGNIFQHFGQTSRFKVYEVSEGKVISSRITDTNGSSHGALAGVLKELGAKALICGGIGGGARSALAENGIEIYGGVSGDADTAVEALLSGKLSWEPDASCNHHHGEHHHSGGSCGSHGCGGNHHGEHQHQGGCHH